MKIEEIIHSIVQNNDQIYGYEIIHFPRGLKGVFIPCVHHTILEKGFVWFKMPRYIVLYCRREVIVFEYYGFHIEEQFKEWCQRERIKEWTGLSVDTIIYWYYGILSFSFMMMILSIDYCIPCFYVILFIVVPCLVFMIFLPGLIFCCYYRMKYVKNK